MRNTTRLLLRALEDRITPATFTVSSTSDAAIPDAFLTIREAITAINAGSNASLTATEKAFVSGTFGVSDTINLIGSGTITLGSALPGLTKAVTINGPGAGLLSISGNNAFRIFNTDPAPAATVFTLNKLALVNGKANEGGAINLADETVNLVDCILSNNQALTEGGAVNIQSSGTLNLTRTTVSGNTAATDGGGIYWNSSGGGLILDSTISGNKATSGIGGGVYFFGTPNASGLTFRNTTISGNSSGSSGGGIVLTSFSGTTNIQNSTITNNTASTGNGGGLSMLSGTGTVNIASTILNGNSAATAADFNNATGTFNVSRSAYTSFSGSFSAINNLVGQNLKLAPLANNGGPTLTHAWDAASPLRGAGSNPAGLIFDARGNSRIANAILGTVDIGAIEMQDFVSNTIDSGSGSLREAVLDGNRFPGKNTITFDTNFSSAKTIALTSGELAVSDTLYITGPGSELLTISGNNASRIFNSSSAPSSARLVIDGLTLSSGKAASGGAIFVGDERLSLTNTRITGNSATSNGGGIYLRYAAASLVLNKSTISGNTANSDGGGIYLFSGGSFASYYSSIVNNKATSGIGGGVYLFGAVGGGIVNSTISGNSSASDGGGIVMPSFSGQFSILNSTIVNNTASTGSGGGISRTISGTLEIVSSIVSGNSNAFSPDISSSPAVAINDSAIGSSAGLTLTGGSGNNLPFGSDLKLGVLTQTGSQFVHIPAPDSPLKDVGSNSIGSVTDQRGLPRVLNALPDIGAVEIHNPFVRNSNDSGKDSLRQQILDANTVAGSDNITFDTAFFTSTKTITLIGGQLAITDAVTINGPGASLARVSGNLANRIFEISDKNASSSIAVTITDLTIIDGRDGPDFSNVNGGGIRVANETLTLDRVVVSNSQAGIAGSGNGGGIFVDENGNLTVRNSTITGNSSKNGGGGIAVNGGGFGFVAGSNLLVENSTISGNTSGDSGGGIYFIGDVGVGGITLRNSTVAGNIAPSGGGLRLRSLDVTPGGGVNIQNCTFTNNKATGSGGGGLQMTSLAAYTVTIASTIASGNTSANGQDDIRTDSDVTLNVTNSALGDPDGFTLSGGSSNNLPFGANLKLRALANNGGPTNTIAFEHDSPLRNVGSNPNGLLVDQRGIARNNGGVDIGAFELNTLVTIINNSGTGSLREAVEESNRVAGTDTITFSSVFDSPRTILLGSGQLTLTDAVTITGKGASLTTVSGGDGSRILSIGGAAGAIVNLSGLTLANGNAGTLEGGAIQAGAQNITLTDMVLSNNKANEGGAFDTTANNGSLTLIRTRVTNNTATGADGAGLNFDDSDWAVTITDSTLSGNTSALAGGAIYIINGSLNIQSSTLSGNKADDRGGGIYFIGTVGAGGFSITNSTLSGNSATDGGGIALRSVTGSLNVRNSTLTGNSATNGGGIHSNTATPTITLTSSLVSGNTASASGPDVLSSGTVNVNFSAIGSNVGFTLSGSSGNNLAFGTNLKLRALANNGGPTNTIAFEHDSPLRNAGSNPAALTLDQRGIARNNGGIDIGAFELNTLVTNANDFGVGSLRAAIDESNRVVGTDSIAFDTAFFNTSTKTITLGSTIDINDAVTINGPGARLATVSGNSAVRIFSSYAAPAAAAITISGLTLANGKSFQGAALTFTNQAISIFDSSLFGNVSTGGGGAILGLTAGGSLLLERSTLSGNSTSSFGGAIVIVTGVGLTIRNSTLTGNSAGTNSGAIYSFDAVTIQNSTIVGNSAANDVGGVRVAGGKLLTIESSIISGNTATINVDVAANTATVKSSAIGSTAGLTFTNLGGNLLNQPHANLKLGMLANNGGPTNTFLPAADSPLVNAGSNPAGLTLDQRGFTRTVGVIDIGAVELQATNNVLGIIINDGAVQRSRVTKVQVFFASPVSVASLGAISFNRVGGGSVTTSTGLIVTPASGTVSNVTFTFGSGANIEFGSLRDGRWTFSFPGSGYTSPQFHRLFGDFDANLTVDSTDFSFFPTFGAANNNPFDFNNNNDIDSGTDFAQFGNRFGLTL